MRHFAFLCLGVVLLAACRKDDVIVCDSSAAVAFADLRAAAPPVQTFGFSLTQAQTFHTQGGATLRFGASVFLLPNGSPATGQAELRLREIYSVPDMLLADMPTTAIAAPQPPFGRQLLASGGEFSIQVWQGSTRLRLGSGVAASPASPPLLLTSPVPTAGIDTTQQMLLWTQQANGSAGTSRDSSGWQLVTSISPSGVVSTTRVPSSNGFYTAALPLDSISRWNIDQLWHNYSSNGSGPVRVEVPSAPAATVTQVYFRPVGINGLGRCSIEYGSTTRWSYTLPYGAPVVAVVLQERAGQLYFGTQRFTTAANATATPTLEALSSAEIIRRIRLL